MHAYKFDGQFHIFRKIFILSVTIIISYLENLVTPAVLLQTTTELNPWKKHEHPMFTQTHILLFPEWYFMIKQTWLK